MPRSSQEFPRPMSVPPSPESLEAMAVRLLDTAEREIPEITYPTDSHSMHIAMAVARAASCVVIWPSPSSCAQLLPESVWEEAKALTRRAQQLRLARVDRKVMEYVRGS